MAAACNTRFVRVNFDLRGNPTEHDHEGADMNTIITGSFRQQAEALHAMSALAGAGFPVDRTTSFFVSPAGQHDLTPIGGDEAASPGMADAGGGAVTGAAIGGAVGVAVGLATLPVLGPGAAVAGVGVGAYVGSLYGALGNSEDYADGAPQRGGDELPRAAPARKSGMLVAVSAPTSAQQNDAIRILRDLGATDIECSEGDIVAGAWSDFNPLAPLRLVAGQAQEPT